MCVVLGFLVIGRGEVQDMVAISGTHISLGGRAGEEEEEEGEKGEDGGEKEEDRGEKEEDGERRKRGRKKIKPLRTCYVPGTVLTISNMSSFDSLINPKS